jgi:cysteinyl-tRNA synthetase
MVSAAALAKVTQPPSTSFDRRSAGTATVVGLGVLTVRADGRSATFETGSVVAIAELAATAERLRAGGSPAVSIAIEAPEATETRTDPGAGAESPLLAEIGEHEAAFTAALEGRDVEAAAQVILDLEASLHGWAADTLQSDELDRGRAALRSMVVRLAAVAEAGAQDPRERLAPFVEALLQLRRQAREDKRYADADAVRDQLVALQVEVRDTPAGTEWDLA